MNLFELTKENAETLPEAKYEDEFNGIAIIPTNHIHDSGFRCMRYVLLLGDEAISQYCVGSDVFHYYGYNPPQIHGIDCTPNGIIRVMFRKVCHHIQGGSSVWAEEIEREKQ